MLFKTIANPIRSLQLTARFAMGAHAHKVTTVLESKHNPQKQKQLRGSQQLDLHMSEYAKDFYYIHKKERSFLSLYNLFSYLPSAVTSQIANLVEDSKVTLVSDQLNLPKISENSVPLYASLSGFATTLRTVNKLTLALPAMVAFTAVMPWLALSAVGLHYFIYFKSSFGLATDRYVIRMQLLPQTQELIYQKISRTGCINTSRVSLSDIEAVNPEVDPTKYKRDLVFERSMKSAIDLNMIFRVKSTGEILMFDREGVWFEEGLNHELMP